MTQLKKGKKIRLIKNSWVSRLEDTDHECLLFCCKGDCFSIIEVNSDSLLIEKLGFIFKVNKDDHHLYEVI